jgi:uncharacterized protein YndB with AHSA1/START domain
MISRKPTLYTPGHAHGASIDKTGKDWVLVLVRELKHSPEKVWTAITDPAHLREWSPFDADGSLATAGNSVKLTTVGAPKLHVTETKVTRADKPRVLEYNWGGFDMKWELEPTPAGTRLTLWTNIQKNFISMGATGWHVCFDVLDRYLAGDPIGRTVGPAAMQVPGWSELHQEYADLLGVPMPKWQP